MARKISDLVPSIWILGNHDTNLHNKDRLDSLSAIFDDLNPKHPIHYLKQGGIYRLYNIDWAVWSCLDGHKNPFEIENYKKNGTYIIGCYHGIINNVVADNEFVLRSDTELKDFDDCDTVFLNDIHKRQTFRDGDVQYSGSWTQTKVNESEDKGVLLWEWDNKKNKYNARFCEIPKTFGYRTYQVDDLDEYQLPKDTLPRKYIARLQYTGDKKKFSATKFDELKKKLQERVDTEVITDVKPFNKTKTVGGKKKKKTKDFFAEYFKTVHDCSKKEIEELEDIDKKYNKLIDSSSYDTGEYTIDECTLHNFVCYGPDNTITWDDHQGIVGIIAENRTGKSTLLDAIMFCLFNKISKVSKAGKGLINDQINQEAFVELKLTLNGTRWRIKRTLTPTKKSARTTLEVYETIDGQEKPHRKEKRQSTETMLRKMFGTPDMFLITVLCTQKRPVEFVDCKNADRLDLFLQFLGVTMYEEKNELVKKDVSADQAVYDKLKDDLEKMTPPSELDQQVTALNKVSRELSEQKAEVIEQMDLFKKQTEQTEEKINKLHVVDVKKTKEELLEDLEQYSNLLEERKEQKQDVEDKLQASNDKWKKFKLGVEPRDWERDEEKVSELQKQSYQLQTQIQHIEKELKAGKVCPTCKQERKDFDKDKLEKQLKEKNKQYNKLLQEIEQLVEDNKQIDNIRESIIEHTSSLELLESKIELGESKIERTKGHLQILEDNAFKIKERDKLKATLNEQRDKLEEATQQKTEIDIAINNNNNDLKSCEVQIEQYQDKVAEMDELEEKMRLLVLYQQAMHRNGVPSMILETYIPDINFEINDNLDGLFDFDVCFELDGNKLDIYFSDTQIKNNKRDAALSSGLEGFVINLAIRAALTRISLLPKPSLFMIDEGFAVSDKDNLEPLKQLLIKLKPQYSNIAIVTHVEDLQDFPEHYIELEKKDGITTIVQ